MFSSYKLSEVASQLGVAFIYSMPHQASYKIIMQPNKGLPGLTPHNFSSNNGEIINVYYITHQCLYNYFSGINMKQRQEHTKIFNNNLDIIVKD